MKLGSLFAGIGGFDLAARWMGWETAWFSEIDPYASAVLQKHWPGVPNHGDITKIDFTLVEPVDMLCGGFPCQDISNAGKRAGIEGSRSGLWGEYARAIRELRPRYVVVENVAALLGRGLDRVLGDLAEIGYDAEWEILSAADVGAPHLRQRVWIVAYAQCQPKRLRRGPGEVGGPPRIAGPEVRKQRDGDASGDSRETLANTDESRPQGRTVLPQRATERIARPRRMGYAPGPGLPNWAEGGMGQPSPLTELERPDGREVERDFRGVAHGVSRRVDRLRGLGNAIVPQCAYQIFTALEEAEVRMSAPDPGATAP